MGAGSAGSVLATRLTEDSERSALLLEAGPDFPDPATLPADVKYGYGPRRPVDMSPVSEYRSHFVARYTDEAQARLIPRGRVTGGSSAVNAQILLRGVPEDYDGWADMGNDMLIHPSSYCVLDFFPLGGDRYTELGVKMVVCLDLAVGSGRIELRCDDYRIQPRLDYNFFVEPFDRTRMREGVRIVLELADHPQYRKLLEERVDPDDADLESDDSLDAWMRTRVGTSHHISGACKMGPSSDDMAVVDQYGRVHGLDGLRVVDASIMPDCIRANTNATTLAIGERVSYQFVLTTP